MPKSCQRYTFYATGLKMIISKCCGSSFQMDTIEMPSYLGYCYILRVVDHLSNYGFVGKVKQRNSEEIDDELVRILSSSMIPNVLQSDNGKDVRDLLKSLLESAVSLLVYYNLRYVSSYLVYVTFSGFFLDYQCLMQFLGDCIAKLNKFFPWIYVVKGRPRHPQGQGCIERSHATFKTALRAWVK